MGSKERLHFLGRFFSAEVTDHSDDATESCGPSKSLEDLIPVRLQVSPRGMSGLAVHGHSHKEGRRVLSSHIRGEGVVESAGDEVGVSSRPQGEKTSNLLLLEVRVGLET